MIQITQVKLPIDHSQEELRKKAAKLLRISSDAIKSLKIVRQSLDARRKGEILWIYTLDVEVDRETQIVRKAKNSQIYLVQESVYEFPHHGEKVLKEPPVIVGSGPAGLFCGFMLAEAGYCSVWRRRSWNIF